jgi:hypothetical protein
MPGGGVLILDKTIKFNAMKNEDRNRGGRMPDKASQDNFNEERNIQGFGRGEEPLQAGDDTPWADARNAAIDRNYETGGDGYNSQADRRGNENRTDTSTNTNP